MAVKAAITASVSDPAPVLNVFRNLTPELQKSSVQSAVFAASAVIQGAVRAAAPVGTEPSRKTRRVWTQYRGRGQERKKFRLAKPLSVSYDFGRLRENIVRRKNTRDTSQGAVLVGTGSAFWGKFLEKGTGHQRAKPFFFRAVEGAQSAYLVRLAAEIEKAVRAAGLRLGGKSGAGRAKPGGG